MRKCYRSLLCSERTAISWHLGTEKSCSVERNGDSPGNERMVNLRLSLFFDFVGLGSFEQEFPPNHDGELEPDPAESQAVPPRMGGQESAYEI